MFRILLSQYPFLKVALIIFIVIGVMVAAAKGILLGVMIGLAAGLVYIAGIIGGTYVVLGGLFWLDHK